MGSVWNRLAENKWRPPSIYLRFQKGIPLAFPSISVRFSMGFPSLPLNIPLDSRWKRDVLQISLQILLDSKRVSLEFQREFPQMPLQVLADSKVISFRFHYDFIFISRSISKGSLDFLIPLRRSNEIGRGFLLKSKEIHGESQGIPCVTEGNIKRILPGI